MLLALALCLSLAIPAWAQEPSADLSTAAQTAAAYAAQYGAADSIQYALWQDGSVALTGHAGSYSRTEDRVLTDDNLYGIGSVSKMYVTAAVMRLVEQGRVSLDAPVTRYLPKFTMADARYKQITVRMLLNHSSGLMGTSSSGAFLFDDPDQSAADDLLERLSTQRLKADPGAYSVYCNDGFTLAQLVVEAVSGKDFMDDVRSNLLTPAGLDNTYAPQDSFDTSRLARTYADTTDTRALPQDTVGIVGTGGLYATASDLASFGGALTETGLLTAQSTSAMAGPEYQNGLWPSGALGPVSYGLGWDSVQWYPFSQSKIQALVKGGDTLRYHAALMVVPAYHMAVAVLSSGGVSTYNEMAAARILIAALAAKGVTVDESVPALPAAAAAAMPSDLTADSGYYASSVQQLKLTVTAAGTMTIHSLTHPQVPDQTFTYCSDGSFRDASGAALLKLVQETNGQTYLYEQAYTPIPGLGVLPTSDYAVVKLPDNQPDAAAQAAWDAASTMDFVPVNEPYSSQVYLALSQAGTGSAAAETVPGYISSDRIISATQALYTLQLPGLYGRDGSDLTLTEENGVTWLQTDSDLYMETTGVSDLFTGGGWSYTTVQPDGYARWYKTGAAAGQTMAVKLPSDAGFWVYDADGKLTASSVLWGDTTAVLPAGGLVVFAGDAGTRFHLHFTA